MIHLQRAQIDDLVSRKETILGEGQSGRVYLVPWEDSTAVLKVSKNGMDNVLMFSEEANLMEKLEGAGGTPILLGYARDPPALLMTQVGCHTLHQLIFESNAGYDLRQLGIKAGRQLLEIHEKDIIHNDFKTNNIIVSGPTEAPVVNIIDLGIACGEGENARLACHQPDFPWIAPEVAAGGPSTKASDVYSFGFLMGVILCSVSGDDFHSMDLVDLAVEEEPSERPTLKKLLQDFEEDFIKQIEAQ
ncbi:tyrosine-protein kinase yes-like [Panulirus ornatus]|uniref:tyrosine-protein kinase yes-like n=1 Tax=Panulirus ornatus TaxID=150431 RepID=UPI003A880053